MRSRRRRGRASQHRSRINDLVVKTLLSAEPSISRKMRDLNMKRVVGVCSGGHHTHSSFARVQRSARHTNSHALMVQ